MRLKEGFRMRTLGRDVILTAEGLNSVNFNKMISLNSSAAYLWERVAGREFTPEDLAEMLMEKYDVDRDTALKDSRAVAESWIEAGIAE